MKFPICGIIWLVEPLAVMGEDILLLLVLYSCDSFKFLWWLDHVQKYNTLPEEQFCVLALTSDSIIIQEEAVSV